MRYYEVVYASPGKLEAQFVECYPNGATASCIGDLTETIIARVPKSRYDEWQAYLAKPEPKARKRK